MAQAGGGSRERLTGVSALDRKQILVLAVILHLDPSLQVSPVEVLDVAPPVLARERAHLLAQLRQVRPAEELITTPPRSVWTLGWLKMKPGIELLTSLLAFWRQVRVFSSWTTLRR